MARGSIIHWGPGVALTIIITLFSSGTYCTLLWFPPWSIAGVVHFSVYLTWAVLIMNYFLKSSWLGPGYVPFHYQAANPEENKFMQYCTVCEGYKPPRSHHCSRCQRCVMKMDHHCPWINNCVGHKNHRSFTLFLFYVPIGCSHATVIMICCVLNEFYFETGTLYQKRYSRVFPFGFNHLIAVLFCIGLSIGVTIAVGILLYFQVKGILRNETAIESWIIEKADRQRTEGEVFVYPYNVGWRENTKQVLSLTDDYTGDGLVWPVVEGCDQFTLTREQLAQKMLKRERTVPYRIVQAYNGRVLTCSHGCRTCMATPWTEEPRIKVALGDTIWVTRWRRYWLYGGKTSQEVDFARIPVHYQKKGWFPCQCAERIEESDLLKKEL